MNEYSYLERHMGTDVSLSFVCKKKATANTLAAKTFATIHDYELRFSRFLPNSELSRLNQNGSMVVSNDFIIVLKRGLELHTLTQGAFNPLLQVSTLGYTDTFGSFKTTLPSTTTPNYNINVNGIVIDPDTRIVTLLPNQQLDFGGFLKGYLATTLVNDIRMTYPTCTGIIINIGGDIATYGRDELHKPFIFELYNPVTGEEIPITLTNTALATSGTYARTWQTSAGKRHHIVDFTSLENPNSDLVATSIIHRNGAIAEALTKLFLVTGVTEALAHAHANLHHYYYFAVSSDGTISTNLT